MMGTPPPGVPRSGADGGMALLVVDVQVASVSEGLWRADEVLGNIATLISECRSHGVAVVHVQDHGGPGSAYEPGTGGWRFHPAALPAPGEWVVAKGSNSAFRETDLLERLRSAGIGRLIVVGLHTEFCVDTTVRVAFEHGFELVMPEMTNSTFDRDGLTAEAIHRHHNRGIFAGRFADVGPMAAAVEMIRREGRRRAGPDDGIRGGGATDVSPRRR